MADWYAELNLGNRGREAGVELVPIEEAGSSWDDLMHWLGERIEDYTSLPGQALDTAGGIAASASGAVSDIAGALETGGKGATAVGLGVVAAYSLVALGGLYVTYKSGLASELAKVIGKVL